MLLIVIALQLFLNRLSPLRGSLFFHRVGGASIPVGDILVFFVELFLLLVLVGILGRLSQGIISFVFQKRFFETLSTWQLFILFTNRTFVQESYLESPNFKPMPVRDISDHPDEVPTTSPSYHWVLLLKDFLFPILVQMRQTFILAFLQHLREDFHLSKGTLEFFQHPRNEFYHQAAWIKVPGQPADSPGLPLQVAATAHTRSLVQVSNCVCQNNPLGPT